MPTLWMEVTNDKLELPVAVADSAEELAELIGISKSSISHRKGKKNGGGRKIIKVKIE